LNNYNFSTLIWFRIKRRMGYNYSQQHSGVSWEPRRSLHFCPPPQSDYISHPQTSTFPPSSIGTPRAHTHPSSRI